MAKKAPWRTVVRFGTPGRFTWEQLEAAVAAVKAKREAAARGGSTRGGSRSARAEHRPAES